MAGKMVSVVTGGAGFIGSNLVNKLLDLGHTVIAVDNLITGRVENLTGGKRNPQFSFYSGRCYRRIADG